MKKKETIELLVWLILIIIAFFILTSNLRFEFTGQLILIILIVLILVPNFWFLSKPPEERKINLKIWFIVSLACILILIIFYLWINSLYS
jgi:hypothetical protein